MLESILNRFTLARRNKKKHGKLEAADIILLRYPKSGITWLRTMISHIYCERFAIDFTHLIGSSEFERQAPACPRFFIAMDNIGMSREEMLSRFEGRKIILLLRDPRDIAVSLFFHFCKRATLKERLAFGIPEDVEGRGIYDFVMNPDWGLPRIIAFENFWRSAIQDRPQAIVVHYEQLIADTERHLGEVMALVGADATAEELKAAVSFGSFENMRRLESQMALKSGVLTPGNAADTDSFKVRKGKIGGYRDYFSPEQVHAIDELVKGRAASRTAST
jgi:hypothetical protein